MYSIQRVHRLLHRAGWRRCVLAVLCAAAAVRPAGAQADAPDAFPRIAFQEVLSAPGPFQAEVRAGQSDAGPPVAARVAVNLDALAGERGQLDALVTRLDCHRDGGRPVWLALETHVPSADTLPAWAGLIRTVVSRVERRAGWIELRLLERTPDVRLAAFALKQAAVDLHAAAPDAQVLVGGDAIDDAAWRAELYGQDVAAYVDGVVLQGARPSNEVAATAADIERLDPDALVAVSGVPLESARSFVSAELQRVGSPVDAVAYAAPANLAREALKAARPIADLLDGSIVALDPAGASLTLSPATVRAALLYDTARFATTLVYSLAEGTSGDGADVLELSLTLRSDGRPTVRDPFTGATRDVLAFSRDEATRRTRVRVPLRRDPFVLDFNDGLADPIGDRSDVTARRDLSVDEIIARHQQAAAMQDRLLVSHVVRARMEQHFRPTAADPGFDVVTDNRFFADRDGVEWEELSFSVNGTKWGPDRPPFPLLQPEKVLSPPLDLRLDADYRYRLDGTARVDGRECYVVRFEPVARERSLYRGTVWIDRETFRRVRLQAVQTGLSAPVVSNEETVRVARVGTIAGVDIHLPVETVARQIVLIAGRNILVEKTARFTDYELNPEDFAERRLEARRGSQIMYRDTDRGTRYYVKRGDTRVVSERATTGAKAMAIGATIDPSYAFPLPMFGINYLDFEFGGPDSQLALLFAGVLALGNIQKPKLAGPLDGSVDFFAIAVPGTDRLYDADGAREEEQLLTWPLSTGANIGWQFTSFQKLSASYLLRFDGYVRDRTTADDYIVPRSTTTHGIGAAWEYRRRGYSLVANGMWYGRTRWQPWGPAEAPLTSPRTYTKYSVSLTKEFHLNPLSKIRLNGAWFGGRRLDRFSQYQFGMFDDTKIHGVPSAGVRFGELAMVRGSYSFDAFGQYRFDLFLDRAWGRDRDAARPLLPVAEAGDSPSARASSWEGITGLGVAFSLRAPWRTMLRAEIGRSFLPDRYRATGSTVVQVMLLKPL